MVKISNALQLKAGAKAETRRMGTLIQPIQFLLQKEKNEEWCAWNLDWLELQGLRQIRKDARRMLKNYKLANGVIDKSDYIVEEDNENAELIDTLTKEDTAALELRFYPIIPNVINVLCGEFAKRNDKITYRTVDELSFNDMLEDKRSMIEETLVHMAEKKVKEKIAKLGLDKTPEGQEQAQQMLSPEGIRSLPDIEEFFKKDYRSIWEEWAAHQHKIDEERFSMKELENIAFRDMLTNDKEIWHFRMMEDDYDIEIWNPVLTFYHKSPEARYISQANWAGRIDLYTVADVIDKYGYLMTADQLSSLEYIYTAKSLNYIMPGVQNDGNMYDPTKTHDWNVEGPSVGMRQFRTFNTMFPYNNEDILQKILSETGEPTNYNDVNMLRVTTAYWKSQRMLFLRTSIDSNGMLTDQIVTEDYVVTEHPIYDNKVLKKKDRETLVFGEHLEPLWINEVYGGIKIGPNRMSYYSNKDQNHDFSPMYLNIKPVKFQFKGDFNLYGCKLPVEGSVFSERNSNSVSLVDKMKAFQIGYNIVNNQIQDILIDELGTIIMLDQNALPKHSMGEDWGKNQYANAYVAMKNFQILPLDTSISNTENGMNFNHYQTLNLEQSQRLLSRVNLANFFKQQCFESIGISPQRLGAINSQETATGVEKAINMSYSQTDMYFVQHSEYLMPRIHQMRTDLAQFYHSTNPSLRLQYMTSMDEKVNFQINGTELLGRDLNVFVSTKFNQKEIMEQIRSLALQNNATGASIYDLGNIIKADSMAEMTRVMQTIEEKANKQQQSEVDHEKAMEEIKQQADTYRLMLEQKFEAEQNAIKMANNIDVAEIRAASMTAMNDKDENGQNDYIDTLAYLDGKRLDDAKLGLEKDKVLNSQTIANEQLALKREELRTKENIANKTLEVAIVNKNQYSKGVKKSTKK